MSKMVKKNAIFTADMLLLLLSCVANLKRIYSRLLSNREKRKTVTKGGLVVADIDNSISPVLFSIMFLIRDDFPAPEGAENTISFVLVALFNILNLFSHFLNI